MKSPVRTMLLCVYAALLISFTGAYSCTDPRAYYYITSPSCNICPATTSWISPTTSCQPGAGAGPTDTVFYHTCDQAEGISAFAATNPVGFRWVTDRFGTSNGAMYLTSGAPLVTPPLSVLPSGAAPRTVTFWLQCNVPASTGVLFHYGGTDGWGNNNQLLLYVSTGTATLAGIWLQGDDFSVPSTSPQLCDGNWHQLALIFDGVKMSVYVDATFAIMKSVPGLATIFNTSLRLGQEPANRYPFSGAYDDFRVYARALTPTELVQVFQGDSAFACPSGSYALPGSPDCSPCPAASQFTTPTTSCQPPAGQGPTDTVFYLSCDQSEGVGAFSSVPPTGFRWAQDRFGNAFGGLYLSSGSPLMSPPLTLLPSGAAPRSVSLWVSCSAPTAGAVLLHWGGSSQDGTHTGFSLFMASGSSSLSSLVVNSDDLALPSFAPPICDAADWHHIAITFDSVTATIYIDGTYVASRNMAYMTTFAGTRLRLGGEPLNQSPFSGAFDDVRIFARGLNGTEVVQLYKGDSAWSCPVNGYRFYGSAGCGNCPAGSQFTSSGTSCQPPSATGPSDTVLWLSCDAAEGLGAFSSTLPVASAWVADRFGVSNAALYLSGGAPLNSPPLALLPSGAAPRAVSFWVRCSIPTANGVFLSWGNPPGGYHDIFAFYIGAGSATLSSVWVYYDDLRVPSTAPPVCDGTWHHIAFSFDGVTAVVYIDALMVASLGMSYLATGSNTRLHIGQAPDGSNRLTGAYDDIRIYDRALASREIVQIFRNTTNWVCPTGSFGFTGSPGCNTCAPPSQYASSLASCIPDPTTGPPTTIFYFSADKAEGVGAFTVVPPASLVWSPNRFGTPNAAVSLSSGAPLVTPNLPFLPAGASPRTFALWLKCPVPSTNGVILHWGSNTQTSYGMNALYIAAGRSQLQSFMTTNGDLPFPATSPPVCDGSTWHHVAVTFDGTIGTAYIDGSFIVSASMSLATTVGTPLRFGLDPEGLYPFTGSFDDVRVYNYALTQAEVAQLYKSDTSVTCPPGSYGFVGSPGCNTCVSGVQATATSCQPVEGAGPTDTVLYLTCDAAESIGAYTSSMPSSSQWIPDRFGTELSALYLSSGAPLISPRLTLLPANANPRSVSLWVSCDVPSTNGVILHWGSSTKVNYGMNALLIRAGMSQLSAFYTNNGDLNLPSFSPLICDGLTWHHISLTFASFTVSIYIDGTFIASSGSMSYVSTLAGSNLRLGSDPEGLSPFSGSYDDVRIYDRALSQVEVVQLYRGDSAWSCPYSGYRYMGSPGCGTCLAGVGALTQDPSGDNCQPAAGTGPSDTVFYHSCDKAEGIGALSSFLPTGFRWVPDRFGRPESAMRIQGVAPLIVPVIPDLPTGGAARTISLWLSCPIPSVNGVIYFWGGESAYYAINALFVYAGQGQLYMFWSNGGEFYFPNTAPSVCDGSSWHHVVITFDSTTMFLFIDGNVVGSQNMNYLVTTSGTNLRFGNDVSNVYPFTGSYDDIRIFNRALSQSEVLQIYQAVVLSNTPSTSAAPSISPFPTVSLSPSSSFGSQSSTTPSQTLQPTASASVALDASAGLASQVIVSTVSFGLPQLAAVASIALVLSLLQCVYLVVVVCLKRYQKRLEEKFGRKMNMMAPNPAPPPSGSSTKTLTIKESATTLVTPSSTGGEFTIFSPMKVRQSLSASPISSSSSVVPVAPSGKRGGSKLSDDGSREAPTFSNSRKSLGTSAI